jgi:hypothetical protein
MTPDNIIKKIKAEIFKYLTIFLNNVTNDKNTQNENNNKIYKINYCFINQLNKEIDLRYLNMPLKNLFSLLNISPKYKTIDPESNKKLIKKLLNGQTDEAIKFAFNMTLRDWLDIFSFNIFSIFILFVSGATFLNFGLTFNENKSFKSIFKNFKSISLFS